MAASINPCDGRRIAVDLAQEDVQRAKDAVAYDHSFVGFFNPYSSSGFAWVHEQDLKDATAKRTTAVETYQGCLSALTPPK
jgi:phosphoribosylformimino-5-aminoimidazole carboxamide ribonucleotide (ProFAR) isomerase